MIANGRYPKALPARLMRAVDEAGQAGLTGEALRELVPEARYCGARDILARLSSAGRVHAAGYGQNRRWFIDAADALIWDENRPRTESERRAAARAATDDVKATRKAEICALRAQPRPRAVWTELELAVLTQHYPTKGIQATAELIGTKTARDVKTKVGRLGLKCLVRPRYKERTSGTAKPKLAPRRAPKPAVLAPAGSAPAVEIKRPRGPADTPGEPAYHPNFKFTRCPAPPAPMRTNTYSNF